ncbi:MAG TPA: AbrB family transcriptional regulator [Devosia sp.]|nr:AbrB family transcriptional regulator [Devosia sp.]
MTDPTQSTEIPPTGFGRWPRPGQWAALLGLSAAIVVPLELSGFPAALLLGPMIAGITLGVGDARVRVAQPLFLLAQVVIGLMMAEALPPAIFSELVAEWPVYVLGIGSVVVVAAGLGILLARLRVLPGTTAIWGSSPGAAGTIVVLADAFGADARLVAFMTYLRVAMVALAASLVARFAAPGGAVPPPMDLLAPIEPVPFALTCGLIAVIVVVTRVTRLKGGGVFLPIGVGVLLQNFAGFHIELPPPVLAVAFALIGWTIGLRFTRDILLHAWRALPAVAGSIAALIAICGGFAFLLVWLAGVDPLTAYLATSPGGADSVAIIAANSPVDVPFVMAMQAGRLLVVTFTGPWIARFIATREWAKGL